MPSIRVIAPTPKYGVVDRTEQPIKEQKTARVHFPPSARKYQVSLRCYPGILMLIELYTGGKYARSSFIAIPSHQEEEPTAYTVVLL